MKAEAELVKDLVLGNLGKQKKAFKILAKEARSKKIFFKSTLRLYKTRKESGKIYVIPAFNLRGLVFELAQAIFQTAKENQTDNFVFEIAPSELGYTGQNPFSFSGLILAAAIESNWQGPIYLQADHLKIDGDLKNIHRIKKLTKAYLQAGFRSFDFDGSALPAKENLELSIKLLKHLQILKDGPKAAVGVEVGEIGKDKTSPQEVEWFLTQLQKKLPNWSNLAKVAVQTGTQHGGLVSSQGKLEKMPVDFELLKNLNRLVLKHGLYGVVQHGASTLDLETLEKLTKTGTLEVHLATAWQNLIFDHPDFPAKLKRKIQAWIEQKYSSKRGAQQSQEQFFYKSRKYAWGQFRKDFLALPQSFKQTLKKEMKEKVKEIFTALKINE